MKINEFDKEACLNEINDYLSLGEYEKAFRISNSIISLYLRIWDEDIIFLHLNTLVLSKRFDLTIEFIEINTLFDKYKKNRSLYFYEIISKFHKSFDNTNSILAFENAKLNLTNQDYDWLIAEIGNWKTW